MRTPLNKGYSIGQGIRQQDSITRPGLRKVMETVATVQKTVPQNLSEYLEGISKAQADQARAAQAKEEATTEKELDKACDEENRAREKEKFFRKMVEKIQYSPRMEEGEYYAAVGSVQAVMDEAITKYRDKAREGMEILIQAREELLQAEKEAHITITALDEAANVLQSKYRYKTIYYNGDGAPVQKEDPNEWRKHAIRYDRGQAASEAQKKTDIDNLSDPWDRTICAAWKAAERVQKDDK